MLSGGVDVVVVGVLSPPFDCVMQTDRCEGRRRSVHVLAMG